MTVRAILLATALLAVTAATAFGQEVRQEIMPDDRQENAIAAPVLRADVTVTSDVVRIGDVIDNAGTAAKIAIYRAPDLGTTGSLPTAQLLAALQAHQVIGVDTKDIKAVSVTRSSRSIEAKDIKLQVAHALEHRSGLGDAANLALTFDRDLQDIQLDACYTGDLQAVSTRYEPRSNRFDVSFEIGNDSNATPTRLRFTGTAIETVEAAVLTRDVQHTEILKSSDVITERRPKAEIGGDAATRGAAVGMQMRRQIRAGQALRTADLAKPDLVQRDDNVTLIYETSGIYLTIRGKALDGGTEGDVVSVLNLQSKRTVSGVVIGRDQVAIQVATPRLPAQEAQVGSADTAQVSVAAGNSSSVTPKAE
jgi:flagellar basal body P-ring formation protein FlgA